MGFKAKARKHRQSRGEDKDKKKRPVKEGTTKCGIKECDNWSDKSMGGRSISLQNAQDVWGQKCRQVQPVLPSNQERRFLKIEFF